MQTLHFSISINAPKEKVWDAMLSDATYRIWTEVFCPGSYYKGSWEKDAAIQFLGPDPSTGGEGGMVSRIAENRPNEYISIEHIGMVKNGIEDTTSEEVKKWAPAYENYSFVEQNGVTEVRVDLDMELLPEMEEFMTNAWPKALAKLKEICEVK